MSEPGESRQWSPGLTLYLRRELRTPPPLSAGLVTALGISVPKLKSQPGKRADTLLPGSLWLPAQGGLESAWCGGAIAVEAGCSPGAC